LGSYELGLTCSGLEAAKSFCENSSLPISNLYMLKLLLPTYYFAGKLQKENTVTCKNKKLLPYAIPLLSWSMSKNCGRYPNKRGR
jgi:hypothetical protein